MSSFQPALIPSEPSPNSSLINGTESHLVDREATVEADEHYDYDDASYAKVIDLLSDSEMSLNDDDDDDITIVNVKPTLPPSISIPPVSVDIDPAHLPSQYDEQYLDVAPPLADSANRVHRVRMTEAQETEIVALSDAGWSQQRIAERLGRPVRTISGFLRRRRLRLNNFLSTLPGSTPAQRVAQQRRQPQHRQQRQQTAPRARIQRAGMMDERVPQFMLKNDPDQDVKPNNRFKQEERL
ncbi:related to RRP1-involved in processing rRNA precursor species to mature rRNAs [Sporisorium scitamineum]|uniref:Related to RRP1-involved in processing rRNA species to mature rRNAs n=1 Tax=Sporisorium scitamineum TaxID=49012 RepID=A0A0F7SBK0_9BASI|nr:related to RRP1-involved in processing rRNA precursor species to mature rRNAs [Sporisorium scitamineum]CDW98158.1 hypothetical protein [Sporisorium scitamineum]